MLRVAMHDIFIIFNCVCLCICMSYNYIIVCVHHLGSVYFCLSLYPVVSLDHYAIASTTTPVLQLLHPPMFPSPHPFIDNMFVLLSFLTPPMPLSSASHRTLSMLGVTFSDLYTLHIPCYRVHSLSCIFSVH